MIRFNKRFKKRAVEINLFYKFNFDDEEDKTYLRISINKEHYGHRNFNITILFLDYMLLDFCVYYMREKK